MGARHSRYRCNQCHGYATAYVKEGKYPIFRCENHPFMCNASHCTNVAVKFHQQGRVILTCENHISSWTRWPGCPIPRWDYTQRRWNIELEYNGWEWKPKSS